MGNMAERYARATLSSNLKDDEHHHVTDTLAAMALGSSDFGALLFRVKFANDRTSYPQLRVLWIDKVTEKADLNHWSTKIKPFKAAVTALEYWLNDRCPACFGLGYQKIPGTPHLSDVACHICEGTGTMPFICDKYMEEQALGLLGDLNELARIAGAGAIKKEADKLDMLFTAYAPDEKRK